MHPNADLDPSVLAQTVRHICDVPPPVDGSCTVLHQLWKVGDLVEKDDLFTPGGVRQFKVIEIRWNQLYPGAQAVTLTDLSWPTPGRYVGCDPFSLRPINGEISCGTKIARAEAVYAAAQSRFRALGAWKDQRDHWARQNWQRAKRDVEQASNEFHTLRSARETERKRSDAALVAIAQQFEALDAPVEL